METLIESLQQLTCRWTNCPTIIARSHGGYKLCFEHLIPHAYLVKLIAFCTLYNYTFYISVENNIPQFEILR